MPTSTDQSTNSNTATAITAAGALDAKLQLEIVRIDNALALHADLVERLLNTVNSDDGAVGQSGSDLPGGAASPDATETVQGAGATIDHGDAAQPDNVAGAAHAEASGPEGENDTLLQKNVGSNEQTVSDATVGEVNNEHGIAPVNTLKTMLSSLHQGADGKIDFGALNAYLAGHAEQAHDLVNIIDQFYADDNHPGNGDGAHSDGMHISTNEVSDAPSVAIGDNPVTLVGVSTSIEAAG